ncbi:MAG: hypothetical protein HON98_08585 [Chloroflexi bacterium]|jgi:hypothetical protein|nr:hypothetical protein [Chloroflexota bacterium]MBT3668638.1 hypothetical protein [Chloroflexota bacterium]MBT4002009.1 hypothetical protein [Chloroflexota bacterium]MBT4304141.1 hypothetical protein [Chloroflexota bacterium]MBT4533225.1 hypothetical protein [Chloroflexota bacterium]
MNKNLTLGSAERNALGLHFKDGFWEILLGSFFVALAFQDILENQGKSILASYTPAIIVFVLMMVLYLLAKRFITTPRIGMVEMKLGNSPQRLRMFIVAIGLQLFTMFIFILGLNGKLPKWIINFPNWTMDAIFGLMMFLFFTLMAYTLQANRFILYGFLLGAAMPIGVMLKAQDRGLNTYPSMFAGAVMLLIGIFVSIQFLRDYPIPQEG